MLPAPSLNEVKEPPKGAGELVKTPLCRAKQREMSALTSTVRVECALMVCDPGLIKLGSSFPKQRQPRRHKARPHQQMSKEGGGGGGFTVSARESEPDE